VTLGCALDQGRVCYDADFYPFGGERDVNASCTQNYKFEGKERDSETQNDDFGARYYSWRVGRWLSADWSAVPAPVPYANLTNPQTLNLYAVVSDNPETFADLDGHGTDPAPPPPPPVQNPTVWSLSWQVSASASFLKQEAKGVWDTTGGGLLDLGESLLNGDAEKNIATTAKWAVTSPGKIVDATKEAGHEVAQTVEAAASLNPRAIGQIAGTIIAAKGAQTLAEESEGLKGVVNRVRSGPNAGEVRHIGLVNENGNIIHIGRDAGGWHIGLGRGGGASGAEAGFHIRLPFSTP
jgi:RHS repeat-associated protein